MDFRVRINNCIAGNRNNDGYMKLYVVRGTKKGISVTENNNWPGRIIGF